MGKYRTFIQFLNGEYLGVIQKQLKPFLLEQCTSNIDDVIINKIRVYKVKFTKSEIDKVEFECYFKSNYSFIANKGGISIKLKDICNYLVCYFKGSFSKGFVLAHKEIEVIDDEEFNAKFTSSLIPVIKKDMLDKYATKFLKYFCNEALETPTRLQLNKILNEKGIRYYKAPLEEKVYGKIYFADDKAKVYDYNNNIKEINISKGTILINTGGPLKRNIASIRNTIVHETVHWFFHRNYFELSQLLDNSLTHAVCYKGGYAENDDIARMERQARALTPRILMPKKQFLNKFKELSKEIDELSKTIPLNRIEKWHKMIVCLSRFFGVSYQSTKYRLKELGKTRADGVFNYIDGNYIQEFTFKSNYLKEHQTFVIERCSALRLLKTDKRIRQAFEEGKLAYVNNMFVLNDRKYIDYKKNILTEYAQNNAHECCLVFDITSELDKVEKQNKKRCFMFSGSEEFKIEAKLSLDSLTYILQNYKQESNDFKKLCNSGEVSKSFYKELNKHFKKSGYTQTLFAEESDINVKYIREILNGTRTPTLIQVVRMGITLNLSYPVITDMLSSLGMQLTSTTDDNIGLIFCLSFYKGTLTMEQIYEELIQTGYGNALQLTKRYIKNHNLIEISE